MSENPPIEPEADDDDDDEEEEEEDEACGEEVDEVDEEAEEEDVVAAIEEDVEAATDADDAEMDGLRTDCKHQKILLRPNFETTIAIKMKIIQIERTSCNFGESSNSIHQLLIIATLPHRFTKLIA
jgi:hypothetical protein